MGEVGWGRAEGEESIGKEHTAAEQAASFTKL